MDETPPQAESPKCQALLDSFLDLPVIPSLEKPTQAPSVWMEMVSLCWAREEKTEAVCLRGHVLNPNGESQAFFEVEVPLVQGGMKIYPKLAVDVSPCRDVKDQVQRVILEALENFTREYAEPFLERRSAAVVQKKGSSEDSVNEVVFRAVGPYDVWAQYDCPAPSDISCIEGRTPTSLAVGGYERGNQMLLFPNISLLKIGDPFIQLPPRKQE